MKKLTILLLLAISLKVCAQEADSINVKADKFSFGLGMGFDYGGFGANLVFYPTQNFGLFAGAGYAMYGMGKNGGVKIRFNAAESNRIKPYITAMYGYNAVIIVKNSTQFNKMFYGTTLGFGIDFRQRPGKRGYWTIGLSFPIRKSDVDKYMDDLEENHGVKFENKLPPVGLTLGYRMVIGS